MNYLQYLLQYGMKKPTWLGIGCVKCGTSWTWQQLKKHPEIFAPAQKEVHFFNFGFKKTLDWYLTKFTRAKLHQKAGEWTPDYFHHYEAMHLIKEYCPDVKLMVIFRHPVDRAFSNWKHALQGGRLKAGTTFDESFNNWRVRERGIYSRWLKRWWNIFPKEQLKIMWYEDIKKRPIKFLQELFQHIGVDDKFVPPDHKEWFDFPYHKNKNLNELEMTQEQRQEWLSYYLPHTEKLEEMTGKDLSHWKV